MINITSLDMERMTKIGMVGVALICWLLVVREYPGYDATGTFEATGSDSLCRSCRKVLRLEVEEGNKTESR